MGFLSSLFQGSTPQPVAGPAISAQGIPKELAPYYKDILGKSQALYNERTAEGFKPYSGPTMADFTPEQQQAFTGIAGLQGSQAPVFGEAMDLTRSAATPMTQDQLTTYMSPYQQAVTDIEKREATKQYEGQVQPALAAQAAATGGFGGSRQAILEGMASDTQQRLLGDIQAKGSQSAYTDAVSRFNVDRQAQGQAGAQLAQMAPNQFKAQLGELGAMQTVGEQKQRQSQTALDEAFRQYQLERNEPYDTMSKYQSVVTGAPIATTQFAQPAPPAPSTAQTLLGGLGTLVGTYGAFGGNLNVFGNKKKHGGMVYAQEGGGIADTMVYRANGKQINYPGIRPDGTYPPGYGYPAGMVNVHPDTGFREKGVLGDIRDLRESTQQRDATPEDIYKLNYNKLGFRDKMYLQQNIFRDGVDYNEALVDYMTNKIPGQRPYEGKPYEGNTNTIVESRMSGDTFVHPENKNMEQTPKEYIKKITPQEEIDPRILKMNAIDPPSDYDPSILEMNAIDPPGDPLTEEEIQKDNVSQKDGIASLISSPTGSDFNPQSNQLTIDLLNQKIEKAAKDKRDSQYGENQNKIQAAEDNYQKLIQARTETNKGLIDESKEAQNRETWLNVAQLFSRMGTATPKQGGILGVIGAGLEAADQTLPQFAATNNKYRNEQTAIKKDMDNNNIKAAEAKINKLEKRSEKDHRKYIEERDESRYKKNELQKRLDSDRTYQLDVATFNQNALLANVEDPSVTGQIIKNFDTSILGAIITESGGITYIEGKAISEAGNAARLDLLKKYIQDVKNPEVDEATAIQNAQDGFNNIRNTTAFFDDDKVAGPIVVTTQKEINDLPSGTTYKDPSGKTYTKK